MYGQFNEVKILNKLTKSFNIPKNLSLNLVHMMELQIQILFIFGKKEIQCFVDRTRFKTFYNFEKNGNSLCTL